MNQRTIITRKEAIEQGLKRYFTGKPCKWGHVADRQVANHTCSICLDQTTNEWNGKNQEYIKEKRKERYLREKSEDPEGFRERNKKAQRSFYLKNKRKVLDWTNKWRKANREKINSAARKRRARNLNETRRKEREYRRRNLDKRRESALKFSRSKKGTRLSLIRMHGINPPKELVESVHIGRLIKREMKKQNQ